jgi:hypothetical protein
MHYIFIIGISISISRSSLCYHSLCDWMHSHPQITVTPLHTGCLHSKFIRSTDDRTSSDVYTNPYVQEEDAATWRRTNEILCIDPPWPIFHTSVTRENSNFLLTNLEPNGHSGNAAFQRLALPFRILENPLLKLRLNVSSFTIIHACFSAPKPVVFIKWFYLLTLAKF